MRNIESKNEIDEIKNWEETIKLKYLKHKTNKYRNEFQQFETIRYFGDNIYAIKVNIDEAEMDQNNPLENIVKFITKTRPRLKKITGKKRYLRIRICSLWRSRITFKSEIYPIKATANEGLKTFTPKQILQRLAIVLAQVKAGNKSKTLLNETKKNHILLVSSKINY